MTDKSTTSKIKLEKILGITTLSNASIGTAPRSSDTFYAAGSVVVRYNAAHDSQKSFYKASKAVSCLSVSPDGRYLAIGERGHSPNIIIWEISSGKSIATIVGSHKHGIGCLVFSPDSRYLVSAGFKHDRQLIIWEWENLRKVCVQKLGNKVNSLCFHPSGSYFISCGDRHLKWWYITYGNNGLGSVEVIGKPASILESHKNAIFMDMKIGSAEIVYCTTSTGLLCAFNDTRFMDMWVQLESSVSYSISIATSGGLDVVIVGCTEGLVRVFSADSLQYLATLPLPVPAVAYSDKYPACLALCSIDGGSTGRASSALKSTKLAAIYADHSLFIWDITDIYNATQYRSFTYHRSCIWDVQFITNTNLSDALFPQGTFVTCSSDNSIRIWSGDRPQQRNGGADGKLSSSQRAVHGEMLHLIEVSPNTDSCDVGDKNYSSNVRQSNVSSAGTVSSSMATTVADITFDPSSAPVDLGIGIPDLELPHRPQIALAPRAMAIHPSGRQLVCGDSSGLLKVYDLASMREVHSTQAHAAEVLTLHYSSPLRPVGDGTWTVDIPDGQDEENELVLLASAGRDHLVHIFNASEGYAPVSTLDNHSSSVTVVKFTPDGTKLLSCGGDRTMVFNSVVGTHITRVKSVQTPHGTINGLAIEATNKFALTSGQDRRLNIWNLQTGKHVRAYKNDAVTGELYKSDVDPSGMFVAACAFDKTVNLFDFFSGDLVAQVSGHSELITSVRFSPDGRYLLSVGGDGCIMVWGMGDPLVAAMQERLLELLSSAQKRQLKVIASRGEGAAPSPSGKAPSPSSNPPSDSSLAHALAPEAPSVDVRKTIADSVSASVASGRGSRWASRVDQQGGYELFGRKMGSAAQKLKLTLEPNSLGDLDEGDEVENPGVTKSGVGSRAGGGDLGPERLEQGLNEDSVDAREIFMGNKLGNTLEAGDDVMACEGSDDETTSTRHDKNTKKISPRSKSKVASKSDYEDDFDAGEGEDSGSEVYLAKATSKIDTLEQSATHLESWLENMIRNGNGEESKTDPRSAGAAAQVDQMSLLSNSLSSLFFKNLQLSKANAAMGEERARIAVAGGGEERVRSEILDTHDDSLPLPPSREKDKDKDREGVSEIPSAIGHRKSADDLLDASVLTMDSGPAAPDAMDVRRRETAAAVAQMKSQLRNMGVLGATGEMGRKLEFRDRNKANTPGGPRPDPSVGRDTVQPPSPRHVTPPTAEEKVRDVKPPADEVFMPPVPPIVTKARDRSRSVSPKKTATPPMYEDEDGEDEYGSVQASIRFDQQILSSSSDQRNSARNSPKSSPRNSAKNSARNSPKNSPKIKKRKDFEASTGNEIGHRDEDGDGDDMFFESETQSFQRHPNPSRNDEEVATKAILALSPPTPLSPSSSSLNQGGGGSSVVDGEDERDIHLKNLYQQQEARLREKAAHCKRIIRELTRAKIAAQSSFDELADLRATLNQTISSTHTLAQSKVLKDFQHPPPPHLFAAGQGGKGSNGGRDELDDTGISDFCGFSPRCPQRGLDSTSDILHGSVVIAEADALINEFRQSFLVPSVGADSMTSQGLGEKSLKGTSARKLDGATGSNRNNGMIDVNISGTTISRHMDQETFGDESGNGVSRSLGPRQEDSLDDLEMFAFLEKYSDRLVDMVSDKVMAKTIAKGKTATILDTHSH